MSMENHSVSIGDTSSKWLVFHGHVSFQGCKVFCSAKTAHVNVIAEKHSSWA